MEYDLLIRAGRVFCAESGLDGPGAVAVRDGRIAAAGQGVAGATRHTFDFPDGILLPGLIDMHAHPGPGASRYDIDPDQYFLPRGVTTVLSQGDAGARDWPDYYRQTIAGARTRVRMALNFSAAGESNPTYCFERMEDADVEACIETIQAGGDDIWGIALNTSIASCGDLNPREIMARGLEAASRTGKPLLFGSRHHPDWPLAEQIRLLRAGDVFTYCFKEDDEGIVQGGRVIDAVWEARERGVLFDVAHGMASFSFTVAETAIAQGFLPDTISTDAYRRHIGLTPTHDLPRTMSKLAAAGMSEADIFTRSTARPAEYLGLAGEIGALTAGACADLTVLRLNPTASPLRDVAGVDRAGACWETVTIIRAGQIIS
jgi:dihydroorotase